MSLHEEQMGVMVDIETVGTKPGYGILSIGAVVFGPDGLSEQFYAPISLRSCTDVGLGIDAATVEWWMLQSEEARRAAFVADAEPIQFVLLQFREWLAAQQIERIWCHGATFDVPMLEAAYKAIGGSAPWEFHKVRDTRTLYELAGVKPDRAAGTHHHALDDAISQAKAAVEALRKISGVLAAADLA